MNCTNGADERFPAGNFPKINCGELLHSIISNLHNHGGVMLPHSNQLFASVCVWVYARRSSGAGGAGCCCDRLAFSSFAAFSLMLLTLVPLSSLPWSLHRKAQKHTPPQLSMFFVCSDVSSPSACSPPGGGFVGLSAELCHPVVIQLSFGRVVEADFPCGFFFRFISCSVFRFGLHVDTFMSSSCSSLIARCETRRGEPFIRPRVL